jgi:hypothetical protein
MEDRSDGTRSGRSEREILVGGLTTFLFMTAIGLASNTLLLLVGFLVSVPINVTGYTDGKTQMLWLLFAVISELFCMLFGFWFERYVGHNAAEYRFANNQPHRTDGLSMILTVGGGVLLHGLLTAGVAVNILQALFFAGPVQYWARFLGRGSREVFDSAALEFPPSVTLAAVGFYLLFFAAALFAGYVFGHAERIRELEDREERARADSRAEAWSEKDAEAAWHDDGAAAGADKRAEERTTLRPETEAFFRSLGKKEKVLYVFLILGWFALDAGAWYLYAVKTGRGFMSPFAVAFPTLLVLPFWPLRLHKRILASSFYAEIARAEIKEVGSNIGGPGARYGTARVGGGRRAVREKLRLLLRSKLGGTEEVLLPSDTEIRYAEGMHVFRAGGLLYPIPCSFDEDRLTLCPVCGHESSPGEFRCRQCWRKLGSRK